MADDADDKPARNNGSRTTRFTQADVKRVLKAAREANLSIASVRIEPDGTIVIIQGAPQPGASPVTNEWD